MLAIITTAIMYLASALLLLRRLFSQQPGHPRLRPMILLLGALGALGHGLLLYQELHTPNGINLAFFNAFSLAAWLIILILLISSISKPVENLGILLFPVAALAALLAWLYPANHVLAGSGQVAMRIHVLSSLLAYSVLTIASVQALLLAIQDNHLRHHHPGGFIRALPAMQTMEALLFEMILAGFALLTVSLISGFVFLEDMFAQRVVHKTVLSIMGWCVFGALLTGRFRYGWRGQPAIIWTLSGFVILMLGYFGSKAVIELILTP